MSLHNLKPAQGSVQSDKRIARGEGSGKGGTSTRGHKGDLQVLRLMLYHRQVYLALKIT